MGFHVLYASWMMKFVVLLSNTLGIPQTIQAVPVNPYGMTLLEMLKTLKCINKIDVLVWA